MANTYTLINSTSLSTTAASVTFSAIPATYDDLLIVSSVRTTSAGTAERVDITFNSISSAYSATRVQGNGATASSARLSSQPAFPSYWQNAGSSTASTFSNQEYYIPKYAGSTNKVMSDFSVSENNATTAYVVASAFLLGNTAAVTSITLTDRSGGSFATNSSFWLYGIKNS